MERQNRPWRAQSTRLRPSVVIAMAITIGAHLGLLLIWLGESPAPGREYNGSLARLNVRLYPLLDRLPKPVEEARTTASTGQSAQTQPGAVSAATRSSAKAQAPATVRSQVASRPVKPAPEDPFSQSRWRESGSPWQEELELAAREHIAAKAAAERSPWPYDTPLPALPFDDYGETPLVMLPPDDAEEEELSVKFLGMSIGISPMPVLNVPNEVGRWVSDNPMRRSMEQVQRSACQPAPGDGADWQRPGWCS